MSSTFQVFGTLVSADAVDGVEDYNNGARLFSVVIQPHAKPNEELEAIPYNLRVTPDRTTGQYHTPAEGANVVGLGQLYGRKGNTQRFIHAQLRSLNVYDSKVPSAEPANDDVPM